MNAFTNGHKWEYRNDFAAVGELTAVACYVAAIADPTPSTPENCGHTWTGFVEVAGFDEIPDPAFHNGIRREMRVAGPVVNRSRSVVIDDAPICVRVSS